MSARRAVAVALLLATLTACQRDPLEQKVAGDTPSAFGSWRSRIATHATPEHRRRVEEALQEIRMNIVGEREVAKREGNEKKAATDSVDDALRAAVAGRPVREVLQLGYELRVQRLKRELAGLEEAMKANARLVTKPGDWESKQHLERLEGRQQERVRKYREDLGAAERELGPLMAASGKHLLPR